MDYEIILQAKNVGQLLVVNVNTLGVKKFTYEKSALLFVHVVVLKINGVLVNSKLIIIHDLTYHRDKHKWGVN